MIDALIPALMLVAFLFVIGVVAYLLVTVPAEKPITQLETVLRQIEAERMAAEAVPVPSKPGVFVAARESSSVLLPPKPEPEPPPAQKHIRLVNTRGKIVATVPEPRRRPVQIKHKSSVYTASHQVDGSWVYRLVSVERKK